MSKENNMSYKDIRSWFNGICKDCGFNIVVTQPDKEKYPTDDYWWYCSNKKCKNHIKGEHTGDMWFPSFMKGTDFFCNSCDNLFESDHIISCMESETILKQFHYNEYDDDRLYFCSKECKNKYIKSEHDRLMKIRENN